MADTMRRRRRAAIETGSPVPGWPPSLAPSLEQLAKRKNSREVLAHKSDPIGHRTSVSSIPERGPARGCPIDAVNRRSSGTSSRALVRRGVARRGESGSRRIRNTSSSAVTDNRRLCNAALLCHEHLVIAVSIARLVVGESIGRTMKIWFRLLLSIAAGSDAVAQDIVVKGNRRIEPDSIRLFFHQDARGKLGNVAIDNALKELYATGLYQEVNIKQTDGHIIVTVVEASVINRVAFEGNKHLTDDQLSTAIQSKPRGTFLKPVVQQDVQHIIERYHDAGRAHARIDPQVVELPEHRVDLIFKINEGERTSGSWLQDIGDALRIHPEQ